MPGVMTSEVAATLAGKERPARGPRIIDFARQFEGNEAACLLIQVKMDQFALSLLRKRQRRQFPYLVPRASSDAKTQTASESK